MWLSAHSFVHVATFMHNPGDWDGFLVTIQANQVSRSITMLPASARFRRVRLTG
jgi:hypothetical protein